MRQAVQALIPYLVKPHGDLDRALAVLVHVPVDLVQVLVDLVQAHSPRGGLLSVESRQVVVGPNLGLIGSVWLVFLRGSGMKQVVRGFGVGLVVSGRKGGLATLTLMLYQERNSGG